MIYKYTSASIILLFVILRLHAENENEKSKIYRYTLLRENIESFGSFLYAGKNQTKRRPWTNFSSCLALLQFLCVCAAKGSKNFSLPTASMKMKFNEHSTTRFWNNFNNNEKMQNNFDKKKFFYVSRWDFG